MCSTSLKEGAEGDDEFENEERCEGRRMSEMGGRTAVKERSEKWMADKETQQWWYNRKENDDD